MQLQWDWLRPVVTVPYVPTLGPIHPATFGRELFADVLAVAGTERFLPYDKDARWSEVKGETVLPLAIDHGPGQTLIPTLSRRGAGTVKVHLYGDQPGGLAEAAELATKLAAEHGAGKARVVSFGAPGQPARSGVACTRVQFREFATERTTDQVGTVRPLEDQPAAVQATFPEFADKLSGDGFAFLHSRMELGGVGPVLVTVSDGRVSGAIGPMETMTDHAGQLRLLPQYFGVLPDFRGHRHGRALWRAAMRWGADHGAAYQLLQTEIDGASDHLCRSEGLTDLGFVYS
ncbi:MULTISPECIES: GNAT family N-acetyltransferase [unclassified Kitasatospora]|uniref:GNAT family N-acetyltransferase n=1 Tax=unclassified Kitasatospora TaxID=2633591 RepID=UPI00070F1A64|nr:MULTISPECIES: GNAT family N-acetyltransferase [unclassified Kitasatospora]KQV12427.1 acetyltransferase [Kitasatospora sp. Root107]KRB66928.1 acetyltransferase [Kitasatospora sp. Root187]